MIIYKINLPKAKDVKTFVKFMQDEYFPAVHKGATRIGKVTDLTLLKQENETDGDNQTCQFYWLVGRSGLSIGDINVDDKKVLHKFQKFNAEIKRIGYFNKMVNWHEKTKA